MNSEYGPSTEQQRAIKLAVTMIKKIWRYVRTLLLLFVVLVACYSIMLFAVFCLPQSWISDNAETSLSTLETEGNRYRFGSGYGPYTQVDNVTDNTMILKTLRGEDQTLLQAAAGGSLVRYWNGFLVLLRPLLIFFNYDGLRYLNIFILLFLFTAVIIRLKSALGSLYTVAFVAIMGMCHFYIFPFSMAFTLLFSLVMLAILFIIKFSPQLMKGSVLYCASFFAIGSITNFFDFLIGPLLTLGLPLVVLFLLRLKSVPHTLGNNVGFLLSGSACWFGGYALTWVANWLLSACATGISVSNMVSSIINFRLFGNEDYPLDRALMLQLNWDGFFPKWFWPLFAVALLLWLACFIRHHRTWRAIGAASPLLGLCAYPYLWYVVMANHSQIHYWFTYRLQAISLFALLCFLCYSLDTAALRRSARRVRLSFQRHPRDRDGLVTKEK